MISTIFKSKFWYFCSILSLCYLRECIYWLHSFNWLLSFFTYFSLNSNCLLTDSNWFSKCYFSSSMLFIFFTYFSNKLILFLYPSMIFSLVLSILLIWFLLASELTLLWTSKISSFSFSNSTCWLLFWIYKDSIYLSLFANVLLSFSILFWI